MLQVCVGDLHRVEFRGVAGQEEQFDLLVVFLDPVLDGCAVMDAQVIENQEPLFCRRP